MIDKALSSTYFTITMTKDRTALQLAVHLATTSPDRALRLDARRILRRLDAVPMDKILDLVPGTSITDRCRAVGVTRTTWYSWQNGITRPRNRAAFTLARITGIDVADIRGRDSMDPSAAPPTAGLHPQE
jgi:hypothetical protein